MIRSNINTPYNMRNVRFDVKKKGTIRQPHIFWTFHDKGQVQTTALVCGVKCNTIDIEQAEAKIKRVSKNAM